MDPFTVSIYLISLVCYLLFTICLVKQALRLRKGGKVVVCLILVGATINSLGIAFRELKVPYSNNFIAVGFLVFLFGFVLLLYRKFKEGEIYG